MPLIAVYRSYYCAQASYTSHYQSLSCSFADTRQHGYEYYDYGSDACALCDIVSEDCLTLNVVRPSEHGPGDNLPTDVWSLAEDCEYTIAATIEVWKYGGAIQRAWLAHRS
jgi:hypothetical protein